MPALGRFVRDQIGGTVQQWRKRTGNEGCEKHVSAALTSGSLRTAIHAAIDNRRGPDRRGSTTTGGAHRASGLPRLHPECLDGNSPQSDCDGDDGGAIRVQCDLGRHDLRESELSQAHDSDGRESSQYGWLTTAELIVPTSGMPSGGPITRTPGAGLPRSSTARATSSTAGSTRCCGLATTSCGRATT
jgi:hypothetical protein